MSELRNYLKPILVSPMRRAQRVGHTHSFLLDMVCALLMIGLVACSVPLPEADAPHSATVTRRSIEAESATTTELNGDLIVFAAASLTEAFSEIAANFETTHPGLSVVLNFAGSQQLAQQLAQGAPADLFASANRRQMAVAMAANRVISGTAHIFAHNRLVVIYPRQNPAQIATLHDLARPGIKLVLAAQEVPAGSYTLDFLEKAAAEAEFGPAYSEAVSANVVSYEQNVRAVLSKVLLGEADAGVVYGSDISPTAADQVGHIEIPDPLKSVADYPIAPIADAKNPAAATLFVAYVLSTPGQQILTSHGFLPAAAIPASGQ